jgi:hypothetical protein
MKDRIEINGVWYIREDLADSEEFLLDPTNFEGCVVENKEWCFEATRLVSDIGGNDLFPCDVDLKVTDKRGDTRDDWKEDNWDNPGFLRGILNNDREAMSIITVSPINMDAKGIKYLQLFLKHLQTKKWL